MVFLISSFFKVESGLCSDCLDILERAIRPLYNKDCECMEIYLQSIYTYIFVSVCTDI